MVIGVAHSVAYALGAAWLLWRLRGVVGSVVTCSQLLPIALSAGLGVLAWGAMEAWDPQGRVMTAVALAVIAGLGGAAYLAVLRRLGALPGAAPALHATTGRRREARRAPSCWRPWCWSGWSRPSGPAPRRATADGVLVLALPTLEWADLHQGETPNLDALLDESAVAALSVRGVVPRTDAGDAYATISAGTRARGVLSSGQVLEPDEDFFGVPAGSVFRRNTGEEPGSGLVSLAQPELVARNAAWTTTPRSAPSGKRSAPPACRDR